MESSTRNQICMYIHDFLSHNQANLCKKSMLYFFLIKHLDYEFLLYNFKQIYILDICSTDLDLFKSILQYKLVSSTFMRALFPFQRYVSSRKDINSHPTFVLYPQTQFLSCYLMLFCSFIINTSNSDYLLCMQINYIKIILTFKKEIEQSWTLLN